SFAEITRFQREHPDWPVYHRFGQAVERSIDLRTDPAAVEAWFARIPPRSLDGVRRAHTVLMRDRRVGAARDLVRRSWTESALDPASQRALYNSFKPSLSASHHYHRVSDLLRRGKVGQAKAAMALVGLDDGYRAAIAARLQMISKRARRNVAQVL